MKLETRWRIESVIAGIEYDWWMDEEWTNKVLRSSRTQDAICNAITKYIADPTRKFICRRYGHVPIMDHCGMPAHDYCAGCNELTPGQAERRR